MWLPRIYVYIIYTVHVIHPLALLKVMYMYEQYMRISWATIAHYMNMLQ